MSRVLKFRAWDARDKRYRYAFNMDDFGNVIEYVNGEKVYMPYIVEQYTGLTDKNGKEIYEGDIIKQLMYALEGKEHITTWVVRWYKEECCFELHYLSGSLFGDSMMSDNEDYKVIGNIHENPELLGGEE